MAEVTNNLVKLDGNKRRLIDFLMDNGEQPLYKISDYFKKLPKKDGGGITKQAVSEMIHSLNPHGLIFFRDNDNGEKMIILNEKSLVIKYKSDKFRPHTVVLGLSYLVSLGIALLISRMWFFIGAAFIITCVVIYLSYLVLKTDKMKDYFYKKT